MSHLEPPIAVAPPLAPHPRHTLHRSVALAIGHCSVCHSMCHGGGCCRHWVTPWQFYRRVVPVYVVNCKNIVNKAKRKTYLSLELGGGRWWWEW